MKDLKNHFYSLKPVQGIHHGNKKTVVFEDLNTTSHVFLRHPPPLASLQMTYDGPYYVLRRTGKTFDISVKGKIITVSIDRSSLPTLSTVTLQLKKTRISSLGLTFPFTIRAKSSMNLHLQATKLT